MNRFLLAFRADFIIWFGIINMMVGYYFKFSTNQGSSTIEWRVLKGNPSIKSVVEAEEDCKRSAP